MKLKCIYTWLFLLLSVGLFAQHDNWQAGARSAAMGNASVANQDVWAGFNNPAALTSMDNISMGLYYENAYLVPEMSTAALAVAIPMGRAAIGVNYSRFGYALYNENRIGLAYAMPLAEWLSMGVQFDYLGSVQPQAYGNLHVLSFDIGLLAEPVEGFFFGAHIFNPASISLSGETDSSIPTAMRLGLAYWFTDRAVASIEAESDMNTYSILKAGIEYQMFKAFYLMAGMSAKPVRASFGAAYAWKSLRLDLAYSYHQQLGSSPHLGISYAF